MIAVGLGFLAGAFALRSEILIQEIRLAEIDQKIAMLHGYGGSNVQRMLADIRALDRFSSSVTCAQAHQIQTQGARIVSEHLATLGATDAELAEARRAFNKVLSKFGMTI